MLDFLWYYGGYLKNFSIILKPLYKPLKVENSSLEIKAPNRKRKQQKHSQLDSCVQIKFTNDHQNNLNKITDILKSPQVMSFLDFEKPFILYCDASKLGLGAVLCKKQDHKLKVISYASRTLMPVEKNYHLYSGKLKFLVLKWAVTDKFRDFCIDQLSKYTLIIIP